ncbi:unnamed protein product, partial [Prorocentrum cordatum]
AVSPRVLRPRAAHLPGAAPPAMAFLRRCHPALALLLASSARADWVQTTVADQAAADKLLSLLLLQFDEKDLQIHTADVQSFYRRDGAVVEEREVRFTVDSALNVDRLRTAVEGVHPHQSPIIVSHSTGNLIKEKGRDGQVSPGRVFCQGRSRAYRTHV